MSRAGSGISYSVELDGSGVQAGVQAAESTIMAHVARMNALRIDIPVALDLSQFTAQAAQVNAQLAQWQQGVMIPVGTGGGTALGFPGGGGGAGGGNTLNATQNNVDLSQTLNATLSNWTEVTNVTNSLNVTIKEAADSSQQTANALGGMHTRFRAIHAAIQGLGLIDEGVALWTNYHGAHADDIGAQVRDQQEWRQHVTQAGNSFFGAGVLGSLAHDAAIGLNNSLEGTGVGNAMGIRHEATSTEIEQTSEDTKRQEKRNEERKRAVDAQKRVSEELSHYDDEAARAAEQGSTEASRAAARIAEAHRRITDLDRWWNTLTTEEQHTPDNVQKYNQARRGFGTAEQNVRTEVGRDEQRQQDQSQERITDITDHANESRLEAEGKTEQAALARWNDGWDKRIAKMQSALNQAEEGTAEYYQRQDELEKANAARTSETADMLAAQARKTAAEREASAVRVVASEARANEDYLRAAEHTYEADEAAFRSSWDAKLRAAEDAVKNAIPNSPEAQDRQNELDAARRERPAAEAARRAGQQRQVRELSFETDEENLRNKGQEGTAEIRRIQHDADEKVKAAEGNSDLQQALRAKEAADLRGVQRELDLRASRTSAQVIDGASRTDLFNTYGSPKDSGKELDSTLKGLIATILREIATNTGKDKPAKTTR